MKLKIHLEQSSLSKLLSKYPVSGKNLLIFLLTSIFLELPVPVAQGTNISGLEPSGDAVEVEGVIAHPPSHSALFTGGAGLVCLTLDAQVHDVVPADGAVVHHNVPGPESTGVQLLHLKSLTSLIIFIPLTAFLFFYSPSRGSSRGHLTVTINIHCRNVSVACRSESSDYGFVTKQSADCDYKVSCRSESSNI